MSKSKKNKNIIQSIDLGRLVAEREEDLSLYYLKPEKYVDKAREIDDPCVFFVGPKGVGKSAILKMVETTIPQEQNRVIRISPEDLHFSALSNIDLNSSFLSEVQNKQWLFKTIWDYVLSVEVLKKELNGNCASFISRINIFRSDYNKKADKLISMAFYDDGMDKNLISIISDIIKEFEVSAKYEGVSGAVAIKPQRTPKKQTLNMISLINQVARETHSNLNRNYYILIDDLDRFWTNSEVQNMFVSSLFDSLKSFSRPPIKCVVSLKQEIFDSLNIPDKDKFRDCVCFVEWGFEEIKEMLAKRVNYNKKGARHNVWGDLFPIDAYNNLWQHTQGIPRELIRLMQISLDVAKRQGKNSVDMSAIEKAIESFSNEKIDDLASEYIYKYHGLEFLMRRFSGWDKEFSVQKLLNDFISLIGMEIELREGNYSKYSWFNGVAQNPKDIIYIFMEIGFLLFKSNRSSKPIRITLHNRPEISDICWFAIHPMYWRALGAKGT